MYATSELQPYRSTQEKLQIWMFAMQHGMSIERVERMLK